MVQPWTAEHVVSIEQAKRLVDSQFDELAPSSAALVGHGWDNTVHRVWRRGSRSEDGPVFRFPRRHIAATLLETEARLLPAIAPRLPLAIPTPRWFGRPTEEYPWPFLGYRWLTGRTADGLQLTPEQRAATAGALGSFLTALHAIDHGGFDAPGDTVARADFAAWRPRLIERLDILEQRGVIGDATPWRRLVETATPRAPRRRCLVHGDLYARHILVDGGTQPIAVIDWGDLHVGDPAVDLAVGWGFLPARARETFRAAYGHASDEETWTLARLRALVHASAMILYGHDTADEAILREGLVGFGHVLDA